MQASCSISRRFKLSLLLSSALLLSTGAAHAAESEDGSEASVGAAEDDSGSKDTIIVLGSRSAARTNAESTAPIDVIGGDGLVATGGNASQLRDALASLVPSFKVDVGSNENYNTFGRPAGLRGLSGAHVLVLVNGKRRHPTAIPLPPNSRGPGANAVDLDQIPLGAIERVEILRDGAAAQYGSDAVAGVINIVLKRNSDGGSATIFGGQHYGYLGHSDGGQLQARFDHGFKLPNDGFLSVAVDLMSQDFAFRQGETTQQIYPKINGQPDPREATRDRHIFRGGLAKAKALYSSYNAELPVGDVTLYSYGTLGVRDIKNGLSFRLPNSINVLPELYPDVLQMTGTWPDNDFQLLLGAKGSLGAWSWDLSTTYGKFVGRNGVEDSLNPSLGPSSPTTFRTFDNTFSQWASNADIRRTYDVGLAEPLGLALGVEYRREAYRTIVKDPLTYADGGYIFPAGSPFAGLPAAVGAQGALTVFPADAADLKRNNIAAYIDVSARPVPGWDIGLAGRIEHFDGGVGNVVVGKATTRVEITPTLALRATVNNSFRAPSLTQQGFSSAVRGYTVVNGAITGLTTVRVVAPDSAAGAALGAKPLKPERSLNVSGGFSFAPGHGFALTVDAYAIWLHDLIALTGQLQGGTVDAILSAEGLGTGQVISYYTNAIDTRTTGVDVVGEYSHALGDWGKVRWSLGFNYNKAKITKVADTPAQLAANNLTLFDRVARGYIEVGNPRTKLILGSDITAGPLGVNAKLQRYGSVQLLTKNGANDQHYGAKWITDLEVNYQVTSRLNMAVGANNLFDVYPDRSTIPDTTGQQLYAQNSPFGFFGGFYYARATVRF